MRRAIYAYFKHTQRYPPWRFVVEMLALTFAMKLAAGLLLGACGVTGAQTTTEALAEDGNRLLIIAKALILAPLYETVIGQWLPIAIIGRFTMKLDWKIGGSALFFAMLHVGFGWVNPVILLPAALFFSWSWAAQRPRSLERAFALTALIHLLHNAIALGIYFALP